MAEPAQHDAKRPLNPAALTVDDAAAMLSSVGAGEITADAIRLDINAGAPTNPDGTIHLVHYGAWLIRQAGRGDNRAG